MSRVRTDIGMRTIVVLSLACALWFTVFMSRASAGVTPTDSTSSSSTTTTAEPTTTTTAAPSTTRSTPSTTRPRASSTTTTAPRSSSTSTTTSTTPPTSTTADPAPEIVTDDTLPPRTTASDGGGLSTDTKLALVVGGLVGVGLLIGLLTFFYWRHTRPLRYMTALDALADVEQKVPKAGADVPTAEQPVIGTGASTGATAAAGATTAVRILDDKDTSTSAAADDEPTVGPDPEPVGLDEPTTITTVEDLRTRDAFEDD